MKDLCPQNLLTVPTPNPPWMRGNDPNGGYAASRPAPRNILESFDGNQIVWSGMKKTSGSLWRDAVTDGALGTPSRIGTELRICSTTRAWARRAAKVRSSVGRVVAGIRFQSARTREGVRSGQQECAAEIVKRQVFLPGMQGMTLTNQSLRR